MVEKTLRKNALIAILFFVAYLISWAIVLYLSLLINQDNEEYLLNFEWNVLPMSYHFIRLGAFFVALSLISYLFKKYKIGVILFRIFVGIWGSIFIYLSLVYISMAGFYGVDQVHGAPLLSAACLGAGLNFILASIYYSLKEKSLCIIFSITAFIFSSIAFLANLDYYRTSNVWVYFDEVLHIVIPLLILFFFYVLLRSDTKASKK